MFKILSTYSYALTKSGSRSLKSPISEPQDTLQEIRTTVMLAFAILRADSCRCTWMKKPEKKWHQALRTGEGSFPLLVTPQRYEKVEGVEVRLHVLVRLLLDADKFSFTPRPLYSLL
jgi:hypothetical protein